MWPGWCEMTAPIRKIATTIPWTAEMHADAMAAGSAPLGSSFDKAMARFIDDVNFSAEVGRSRLTAWPAFFDWPLGRRIDRAADALTEARSRLRSAWWVLRHGDDEYQ